jgi:hypothetical protein
VLVERGTAISLSLYIKSPLRGKERRKEERFMIHLKSAKA